MRTCIRAVVADPKMKLIRDKMRATSRGSAMKLIPGYFSHNLIVEPERILKHETDLVKPERAPTDFSFLTPGYHRNGTRRAVKITSHDCAVILLGMRFPACVRGNCVFNSP